MTLTFSCVFSVFLLIHSPECGTEREVDGQVVITVDGSYRAAVPTSLWVWALEHSGEKVCAVDPVALTCSVSGVFRHPSFFPKGPELSLSQVNCWVPYLRWLGDAVWVIRPLPLLRFVFVFLQNLPGKEHSYVGCGLGVFSAEPTRLVLAWGWMDMEP